MSVDDVSLYDELVSILSEGGDDPLTVLENMYSYYNIYSCLKLLDDFTDETTSITIQSYILW